MNTLQKVIVFAASKALGFPIWTGGTRDTPPGGWRIFDWTGDYSELHEIPAFIGCSRVLQSVIGSPPFEVFRLDSSEAPVKFSDHPLYPILFRSPNRYQTSLQFRQFLTLSYCTHGNAYAQIVKLGNRVVSLNPLLASRMVPRMIDGKLVYEYTPYVDKPQQLQQFAPEEIIHIKHASRDGLVGHPPVPRKLLERALTTAAYGAAFMRNQGRPSGVVESAKPAPKDPDFLTKWREDWRKIFSGENAGATAYLSDGATYKIISSVPNDAQYVETLKQLDADFCGIFGVPLQLISSQDKAPTYASSEQFSLQFIMYTGAPLAEDFEQEFNKKLFPNEPQVFCKMDLESLIRGDAKSQAEYLVSLTGGGLLTRNEGRRKLRYAERPEANQLTVRAYEIDLNALPKLSAEATPGVAQSDIRNAGGGKSLPSGETKESGFQFHVDKLEQTVMPQKPMRKTGRVKRNADGSISMIIDEIEESGA